MPKKTLIILIENGLSDPEIQKITDIKLLLKESENNLNDGYSPGLVSRKINNGITKYLIHNNFKAPQSILNLSNYLGENDDFFQQNKKSINFDLKNFLKKIHKKSTKK